MNYTIFFRFEDSKGVVRNLFQFGSTVHICLSLRLFLVGTTFRVKTQAVLDSIKIE